MTGEELCGLLGLAPETPPAEVIQARARRLAEIDFALREEDLPKPVKLKLHQERGVLEPVHDLIAELEVVSRVEAYLVEIAAEFAKPNAGRGVIRLCLGKLKPLVPEVKDEATRFGFEKQVIEIEERIGRLVEPAERSPVAGGPRERIEGYFAEIATEQGKPDPGRGVIRLCLGKLKPLVDEITDEAARYGYEKRLVQIEERMGLRVSTAPFFYAKDRPPPAVKPEGGGLEPGPAVRAAPQSPPPAESTPGPARGTLLELSPMRGEGTLRQSGPPIHFVARPRFVLGRRRASVDFAATFLPENDENRRKNETISRINTTFFVKDSQIWVQDGELQADGKVKPSTNGTIVDGQQITVAKALSFTKERRLKVGQHNYELAVLQLPAAAPEGPPLAAAAGPLSTLPTQVASREPAGCLRFLPTTNREVAVVAVWLFTDAAVGSDPQSAVRLEPAGLPPVAARFHHWQGGFWLEAPPGGKSAVMFDERRLAAGEVVPLQAAQVLRLGELSYEVRVS